MNSLNGVEGLRVLCDDPHLDPARQLAIRVCDRTALFADILGFRGTRGPITAVVANLADPKDQGCRKALARARRAMKRRA